MRVFFIGFGQAGGKLVDMFLSQDKKTGANSFRGIIINTARTDLMGVKNIPMEDRLLIGQTKVKGHGVGTDNVTGAKVAADEMIVLDSVNLDAIKTKEIAKMFEAIKAQKKVLVVLPENNEVIYKSTRNIEGAKVSTVNTLNVYDILNCDTIVVLKDAVTKIEEVYA